MKKRAFTLVEVVVSMFITLFVFVPTLKINYKQMNTHDKIYKINNGIIFFISVYKHFENSSIFFEENFNLNFENEESFKNNEIFSSFDNRLIPKENFNLIINIKKVEVDFHNSKKEANLIKLEFKYFKKNLKLKLIKFKK